jgi:hypothetical protein
MPFRAQHVLLQLPRPLCLALLRASSSVLLGCERLLWLCLHFTLSACCACPAARDAASRELAVLFEVHPLVVRHIVGRWVRL